MTDPVSRDSYAAHIAIGGVVQGVGFRPFVYNAASRAGVTGWVLNGSAGVTIHAEGPRDRVLAFLTDLRENPPAMSRVESFEVTDARPEGYASFEIHESIDDPDAATLISPDIATCPDCTRELFDKTDRRYHYPFINCTNCGPRFTIIDSIPYDRPFTSMRDFPMCERCTTEYKDPADRRFHAQPDACFVCGPRLYFWEKPGKGALDTKGPYENDARPQLGDHYHESDLIEHERQRSDAIIERAVHLLRTGSVVAIKGLGGYHLACDAHNETAVRTLRERKHRYGKPLAIMVQSVAAARELCEVDLAESELLTGTARPIVLLRRKADPSQPLAPSVATGVPEIGVMLPYTPVQHLLLDAFDGPLVMTSGNISDEPIVIDDALAREKLSGIADAFLSNDREILARYDDSVVRVIDGTTFFIRRARGYAPFPVSAPTGLGETDCVVFGPGPEQKNTFAFGKGSHVFVSQHFGDLETAENLVSWEEGIALYRRLFRIDRIDLLAYDLHPEYLSTKWTLDLAARKDIPAIGVQHHHAHIAAIAGEHGIEEDILGIAFDGTGYGPDKTIWGGEALISGLDGFSRFAHLTTFPLPGGAAAVRRPARIALALLEGYGLGNHPGAAAFYERLSPDEISVIPRMVAQQVNSPLTSSMGRLFDVVAALTGIADDATYEGSPAIELEAAIDPHESGAYAFSVEASPLQGTSGGILDTNAPVVIEFRDLIVAVLDDIATGVSPGRIAARFHHAVRDLICELACLGCARTGNRYVALGGGVFMNRYLLTQTLDELSTRGFVPLTPISLPQNDGCISYGQVMVALAKRKEG